MEHSFITEGHLLTSVNARRLYYTNTLRIIPWRGAFQHLICCSLCHGLLSETLLFLPLPLPSQSVSQPPVVPPGTNYNGTNGKIMNTIPLTKEQQFPSSSKPVILYIADHELTKYYIKPYPIVLPWNCGLWPDTQRIPELPQFLVLFRIGCPGASASYQSLNHSVRFGWSSVVEEEKEEDRTGICTGSESPLL